MGFRYMPFAAPTQLDTSNKLKEAYDQAQQRRDRLAREAEQTRQFEANLALNYEKLEEDKRRFEETVRQYEKNYKYNATVDAERKRQFEQNLALKKRELDQADKRIAQAAKEFEDTFGLRKQGQGFTQDLQTKQFNLRGEQFDRNLANQQDQFNRNFLLRSEAQDFGQGIQSRAADRQDKMLQLSQDKFEASEKNRMFNMFDADRNYDFKVGQANISNALARENMDMKKSLTDSELAMNAQKLIGITQQNQLRDQENRNQRNMELYSILKEAKTPDEWTQRLEAAQEMGYKVPASLMDFNKRDQNLEALGLAKTVNEIKTQMNAQMAGKLTPDEMNQGIYKALREEGLIEEEFDPSQNYKYRAEMVFKQLGYQNKKNVELSKLNEKQTKEMFSNTVARISNEFTRVGVEIPKANIQDGVNTAVSSMVSKGLVNSKAEGIAMFVNVFANRFKDKMEAITPEDFAQFSQNFMKLKETPRNSGKKVKTEESKKETKASDKIKEGLSSNKSSEKDEESSQKKKDDKRFYDDSVLKGYYDFWKGKAGQVADSADKARLYIGEKLPDRFKAETVFGGYFTPDGWEPEVVPGYDPRKPDEYIKRIREERKRKGLPTTGLKYDN